MPGASKLTISQVNTQDDSLRTSPIFSAMLNPAKYTLTRSVSYTGAKAWKGPQAEARVNRVSPDRLELEELILDGTGVVDAPASAHDVDGQLTLLRDVLHDTDDAKVRHAVVAIQWGKLLFKGRLTSMRVQYTLFDAAGTPLRARVKLSFEAYEKTSKVAKASNPALQARQVRLVDGDSLPLLCFTYYDDPGLALAVALYNGLNTIRQLAPGMALTLPRLG